MVDAETIVPNLMQTGRRSPLDGRRGGFGSVALTPAQPAARLSLRARTDAVKPLSEALGLDLPTSPKTSATSGSRHALWLGPDEWLLIDDAVGSDLAAAAARAGVLHSAVDISHRNTAIVVAGEGAEATLAAGCPQDLSLKAFPVGACSRTLMAKIEIVVWRRSDDEFQVECWRSFAGYAFAFLEEAARDAGG